MPAGRSTLRTGSRAAATREPRQVRKEAAISAARRVPRTGMVRADHPWRRANVQVDGGCTALRTSSSSHGSTRRQLIEGPMPPEQPSTRHQALYRRWRAQSFAQIVGQEPVVETLRNAVRLDRVAHAYLFVGPRGTGKTSMARI